MKNICTKTLLSHPFLSQTSQTQLLTPKVNNPSKAHRQRESKIQSDLADEWVKIMRNQPMLKAKQQSLGLEQ